MTTTVQPHIAADAYPGRGAAVALALQAAMLAHARRAKAGQGLVIGLARQFNFDRVWLATADRAAGPLALAAVSDGILPAPGSGDEAALLESGAECADQASAVLWPEPSTDSIGAPRITRAHAAAAARWGAASSVATVPLVAEGRLIGCLGVMRQQGPAIDAALVEHLEHLACLVAPLLALMAANERGPLQRARDDWRQRWQNLGDSRQRHWRQAAAVLASLALLALLLPWPAQVAGPARLEGAIQRMVSAPMDGYVQQAHVRAGDQVKAGQVLLELADKELQLERQRWQSQLAQQLDGLSAAQARADRSQLVLLQSRADEAQAQLELVELRLERSRLVAPFDAVVVQGDWSQQLGAPVKEGSELLTLAPSGRYRVIVQVDERDLPRLEQVQGDGLHGSLTLSALPWDTLPLRVTRVSPVAKAVEGRNVFELEAELAQTPAGLRPGLQGQARIHTQAASPLLHFLRRGLGHLRLTWWEWLG